MGDREAHPDARWWLPLSRSCGPLVPAAEAFVAAQLAGVCPRGTRGLVRLADELERWAEKSALDEEQDRRFVEGAGALLALLLADHIGVASHVCRDGIHRLRLGRFGCCDPFACIERALQADNCRATLASQVRRAESEAEGHGPVARVIHEIEHQLEQSDSELRVSEHFDLRVWLGAQVEIDLRKVVAATSNEAPTLVREAVAKLLAPVLSRAEHSAAVGWAHARRLLLPRLIGPAFPTRSASRQGHLATLPLMGDVRIALALDHGDRTRFLREDELRAWGVACDRALTEAVANLAGRWRRARFVREQTQDGPMLLARSGDGLDASRLLLPAVQALFAAEFAPQAAVAVPHRDLLIATPAEPASRLRDLAQRAKEAAARAPHRITTQLFCVRAPGQLALAPLR
ncbi:MAG: DUF1444 family protein [Proteobacteria bacterium]|nr:DUF1444 family protein [Pseudomonadota bacterium]